MDNSYELPTETTATWTTLRVAHITTTSATEKPLNIFKDKNYHDGVGNFLRYKWGIMLDNNNGMVYACNGLAKLWNFQLQYYGILTCNFR